MLAFMPSHSFTFIIRMPLNKPPRIMNVGSIFVKNRIVSVMAAIPIVVLSANEVLAILYAATIIKPMTAAWMPLRAAITQCSFRTSEISKANVKTITNVGNVIPSYRRLRSRYATHTVTDKSCGIDAYAARRWNHAIEYEIVHFRAVLTSRAYRLPPFQ